MLSSNHVPNLIVQHAVWYLVGGEEIRPRPHLIRTRIESTIQHSSESCASIRPTAEHQLPTLSSTAQPGRASIDHTTSTRRHSSFSKRAAAGFGRSLRLRLPLHAGKYDSDICGCFFTATPGLACFLHLACAHCISRLVV